MLSAKGLTLDDLKSANGTYVTGNRLAEPMLSTGKSNHPRQSDSFPWPEGSLHRRTSCRSGRSDGQFR